MFGRIFFLFSILMIQTISGANQGTFATIKDRIQSTNKTKLGIKALGTAASYWTTYKMLQLIDRSAQNGVKVVPGKGVGIDLTAIPAGIIGISSAVLGTMLLASSCQQIEDEHILKSHTKISRVEL